MAVNSSYREEGGYVDIYGNDVKVSVCEKTGNILIPIDEFKRMGFSIYRRSQYNRLLVDDNQFTTEFNMYMLESAQSYMLKNRFCFKEDEILASINKCKEVLTGLTNSKRECNSSDFRKNRVIETSGSDISVTSTRNENSSYAKQNSVSPSGANRFGASKTSRESPTAFKQNNLTSISPAGSQQSLNFQRNDGRKSVSYNQSSRQNGVDSNIQSNSYEGRDKTSVNTNGGSRQFEESDKLVSIQLVNSRHKILVTFVEKPNVIWVQDVENLPIMADIMEKIKEEEPTASAVGRKFLNTVYLAQDEEGTWCRCKVVKFKPPVISFFDYGNTAPMTVVKEASSQLAEIPMQAVRMTFLKGSAVPQQYEEATVNVIKKFENGTYLVEISEDKKNEISGFTSPPSPIHATTAAIFTTRPPPLCNIQNEQKVMIVAEKDGKMVVRTKECYEALKRIEVAISICKLDDIDGPQQGQLVLCLKGVAYLRGIISKIEGKAIYVELLDYCETVKVDAVKHITELLATEPITYCISPPIKGWKVGNEQLRKFMNTLIETHAKGTVMLQGNQFDLILASNKQKLSEKLQELSSAADNVCKEIYNYYKPPLGSLKCILQTFRDKNDLTVAPEDTFVEFVEEIVKCEVEDVPYEPKMGELCFGFFDESWSRCLVKKKNAESFEVHFVDFGNTELLGKDQLKKLTNGSKKVPIMGIQCRLIGLPSISNIDLVLEETMKSQLLSSYDVHFKKQNGNVYDVEIPSLYQTLN